MAYPHNKQHIMMTTSGISATTSGDKASWSPGYMPMIVRAVGVTYTAGNTTAGGFSGLFNHLDLASGSTASAIGTLIGNATDKKGHVIYKDGLNVEIDPGQSVVFNVTKICSGVCNVQPWLYVEPRWEQPGNDTGMRETT